MTGSPLVLDTNIVLDVFVFADEASVPLRVALRAGSLQWLATAAMREELERVLAYPQIEPRLGYYGLAQQDVLAHFVELLLELRQPVGAGRRLFLARRAFGVVRHILLFVHAINLDNAWAVKSTMGTTRA